MAPSDPSPVPPDPAGLKALLTWYQAMGIDAFVGTVPCVHRGVPAQTQTKSASMPAQPAQPGPKRDGGAAVQAAKSLASSAADLEALRAALDGFEQCPLKQSARNLVFADGAAAADLMLVGEAPGQMEDAQGLPFVGRSGQLLDRMLKAIGRDRTSAYIANILPWRPPMNRKPELTEIHMCLPFVERHIELMAPRVVVALGGTAAQHLLGRDEPMRSLRGQWHTRRFGGHEVRVLATYHPAYLLRTPIAKRAAWADFLMVKQALGESAPA